MQMMPFDFWHSFSFADFNRKSFFFFRNKNEEFKDNWERLRQHIHVTASVHGVKERARELMPFGWDKGEKIKKAKPVTKEDIDGIVDRYKNILK